MAGQVSTIPACLDALIALAKAACPDADVFDGDPPVEGDVKDDLVAIGWTGQPDEVAIEASGKAAKVSGPDAESYDVQNVIECWAGAETDAKPVRDTAFAMLNAISSQLKLDVRLGGVVAWAQISVARVTQAQTDQGAVCQVQFTVHVEAFA